MFICINNERNTDLDTDFTLPHLRLENIRKLRDVNWWWQMDFLERPHALLTEPNHRVGVFVSNLALLGYLKDLCEP